MYTFFDELGVEPLGFVGDRRIEIQGNLNAIHRLFTSKIITNLQFTVKSASHKTGTNGFPTEGIGTNLLVKLPDCIHRQLVYYKFNANIDLSCGRYIFTPKENRYLETPKPNC